MLYAEGGEYLESVHASGSVAISEIAEDASSHSQWRRLNASSASFRFMPQSNYPREMDAAGAVQIVHRTGSKRDRSGGVGEFQTTSDRLKAFFEMEDDGLAIESFVQSGSFVYQDETRIAKAGECSYRASSGVMVLTESPEISDDMGVTTGDRVEYDQARKILSVKGNVRSVLRLQQDGGAFLGSPASASAPVVIVAEEMRYRTEMSHLSYLTNVQMLTESQQLQTQTLEIFGEGERVEAMGGVLHLISQEERSGENPETHEPEKSEDSRDQPIIIRSSNLRYLRDSKELFYSGEVHLNSRNLILFSSSLDAVLDEGGKSVDHAIAKKDVFMRRGSTECKGEVAYWYLDPGKLIVEGNPAEAYDPDRGRSLARRLTYFTTDDRILLESEQVL
jgi:lipopolysaccharide export system protein LptA